MDDLLEELDSFARTSPTDRDRRRRFVATAAIVGLAFVGIGQLTTGAFFEDSATAAVTYATGDVEIQANSSATATLAAASNLAPGDTVYRAITVTNAGSLDLRYAVTGITTTQTKSLGTVLDYSIYSGVTPANCGLGNLAGGTAVVSHVAIGTTETALIGDKANGVQGNERAVPAAAAPANSDELCVAMLLPTSVTSTFALANAAVTLTFYGEQTAHNP